MLFSLFSTLYKITVNLQSLSLCPSMLSLDICDFSHVTMQISEEQIMHYRTKNLVVQTPVSNSQMLSSREGVKFEEC